ncbi:MAG: hypothetical protein NZ899_15320, partial [Thermoguttaceae bacterium]|nr:hypothetical protein [Thermoguttaceae bacterium]
SPDYSPIQISPAVPLESWDAAPEWAEFIFPPEFRRRGYGHEGWKRTNLRTTLSKIIRRAGVRPWPRLGHNLRASCESDLAQAFPLATGTKWLGNTPSIALRHYVDPTDTAYRQAVEWGHPNSQPNRVNPPSTSRTKIGTVVAQNPAQNVPSPQSKTEKS